MFLLVLPSMSLLPFSVPPIRLFANSFRGWIPFRRTCYPITRFSKPRDGIISEFGVGKALAETNSHFWPIFFVYFAGCFPLFSVSVPPIFSRVTRFFRTCVPLVAFWIQSLVISSLCFLVDAFPLLLTMLRVSNLSLSPPLSPWSHCVHFGYPISSHWNFFSGVQRRFPCLVHHDLVCIPYIRCYSLHPFSLFLRPLCRPGFWFRLLSLSRAPAPPFSSSFPSFNPFLYFLKLILLILSLPLFPCLVLRFVLLPFFLSIILFICPWFSLSLPSFPVPLSSILLSSFYLPKFPCSYLSPMVPFLIQCSVNVLASSCCSVNVLASSCCSVNVLASSCCSVNVLASSCFWLSMYLSFLFWLSLFLASVLLHAPSPSFHPLPLAVWYSLIDTHPCLYVPSFAFSLPSLSCYPPLLLSLSPIFPFLEPSFPSISISPISSQFCTFSSLFEGPVHHLYQFPLVAVFLFPPFSFPLFQFYFIIPFISHVFWWLPPRALALCPPPFRLFLFLFSLSFCINPCLTSCVHHFPLLRSR